MQQGKLLDAAESRNNPFGASTMPPLTLCGHAQGKTVKVANLRTGMVKRDAVTLSMHVCVAVE
ncbi:hypothetical protein RvVAT039_26570 [Agrobacterium vitis]|nr:hypothetical protein RvVAT039_26570 [Agrobacterium vitis]